MPRFFVDPDIAIAQTIDTSVYTSRELLDEMREKIFSSCWQFAGNTDLLKESGSCHPFMLLESCLDEPLVLTKDEAGRVHCLSNVCTHRGNLLVYEPCTMPNIRCRYHGRLFQLDGKFKSMPEFREVKNFPSPGDDLQQLELFHWNKFLFTSLNPKFPAENFLRDVMARVDWMPLSEFRFRPDLSRDYTVDANWALYCENYLEGFHIPYVHAGLNAVIDYSQYETELFFPCAALQIGVSRTGRDCFELPETSVDFGRGIAAYYFWVFPNMMFNFYPWGLSINIVQPLAVNKTKVSFLNFVWQEEKRKGGAGGELDRVELEDEEIVKRVQRGVRSRFYKHGRYSVTREKGTHHFHKLLADFLNS